jgi:glycerol-3-phosphate dehydrogenase subunit B
MNDLLVIGAGLSGLMAADAAARAGLAVQIIAKGLSSMHWTAGTVDVLGYLAGREQLIHRPLSQAQVLTDTQPHHPYALLAGDELAEALNRFLARFAALSVEIGLPYEGATTPGDNLLLPSPVGAIRPTYLAPQAQLAGDLSRSEPMLIVGFQGMRDFYPVLIAENLSKQGHTARSVFLPLSLLTDRRDSSTVHFAQALDNPARRERLGRELRKLVEPGERVGLPAIVGMDDYPATFVDLQQLVDAPIFEIPTLPPSVPGIRLFKALRRHLGSLGARVEAGMEAIEFKSDDQGRIQWIETETSARPLKHRARNFLLATGGILGGGINSDHTGRIWETIFDLPLTISPDRSQWFRTQFLDPAGQPVFHGGVPVDGHFQPVGVDGEPVFTNLWACGGILTGADPIRERSLEGIAISTGIAAANDIIKTAKA